MPYEPHTRDEIREFEHAVHDLFRPPPKDAADAEADFKNRKVIVARFRRGRRTAVWHLNPAVAKQLAARLSSAADRILSKDEARD